MRTERRRRAGERLPDTREARATLRKGRARRDRPCATLFAVEDEALRELVQTIERDRSSCPVTLVLSSAIRCGTLVSRAIYLKSLEELARRTDRTRVLMAVLEEAGRPEEAGTFLHLLDAILISGGQGLESNVTSENGRTLFTRPTPARVRVDAVQDWQIGTPFERAREP